MRYITMLIIFGITLNTLFGVYYIQLLEKSEKFVKLDTLIQKCHEEIQAPSLALDSCEQVSYYHQPGKDDTWSIPLQNLVQELLEYKNAEDEIKILKKEVLAFASIELKTAVTKENEENLAYIKNIKYSMLGLNLLFLIIIIILLFYYFNTRKITNEKLPELKKLFLHLLENNFIDLKPLYTSLVIPTKSTFPVNLDFLGTVFFSILKVNNIFYKKESSLSGIKMEMKASDNVLRIIQKMSFLNNNYSEFEQTLKDEIEYKILEDTIKNNNGYIKVENDKKNGICYLEIYFAFENNT